MQNNSTTFAQQVNAAQKQAMADDPGMICMGLGIDDPKGIFDTTSGLAEAYGPERVFDMPTAENGMTGVGVGAAQAGTRVLMTHQRVDFFLLAMDQLVNNAAKWHYMFNGQMRVPLTIRLIVGRGWGQGPTHAQNLQNWFAHIPGLKVVIPSKTDAVGQQLYQAIMDDNPTVFIEHRWLHNQACERSQVIPFSEPFASVRTHCSGETVTLVANSYMVLEALQAAEHLRQHGVTCDVIETVGLDSRDWTPIYNAVKKTGRLLVCDSAHSKFSVASEIIASCTEQSFGSLKAAPGRLGLPMYPEPTSFGMTKGFYNTAADIVQAVSKMCNTSIPAVAPRQNPHDVPGHWFQGPF
ncbi:alpha-ketoacid dehydrogenase subunit beta [Alteromonas sp. RKMC-009]|uniref:alpha-ketoacid dehydrogenase subunit beta n=1 Tax=Alteromonas sp. RKMC-009 TaxID=2267264 RepID=UPI000E6801E7|nr:transketolase C-terminal domain-containing protein [Alteromonas sp. RKMC-009]AYA66498.1 alpha-ketoacid dehydrogenase subunit beta [Alteromonas sp. RKMC-009]